MTEPRTAAGRARYVPKGTYDPECCETCRERWQRQQDAPPRKATKADYLANMQRLAEANEAYGGEIDRLTAKVAEARAAALDAWSAWLDDERCAGTVTRTAGQRGFAAIDALREVR